MALGGGTFLTQNKILPGAYINFISVANASATLSDRGIATIPLEMNWGPEGEVITVELGEFQKNSQKIFGYAYTADELKPPEFQRRKGRLHLCNGQIPRHPWE
jgi:hypothetical protein